MMSTITAAKQDYETLDECQLGCLAAMLDDHTDEGDDQAADNLYGDLLVNDQFDLRSRECEALAYYVVHDLKRKV